ncbi:lipid-binding SYLF domain-containing protein [Terasakiella sp. A23]|uniref:lipid-binding SYLF domain-containing protein n=1 Tax=Terasakiella sp. FCG-A23 TaxID=3080561 RepID=UPI0029551CEE|nr:lipid-binding SYLF domain-containing protein [Terasakiella sp. A23]MDV7339840.1 lipid-binding SYLF domain-containing protein [Terasakiella sp. A23]
MKRLLAVFVAVFTLFAAEKSVAANQDAIQILLETEATARHVLGSKQYKELNEAFNKAVGVVIVPRLLKGGFIIGGEYGNAVLLAKKPDGTWSYPAFYTMGGGSLGLQIGLKDSQIVYVIRTESGLNAILNDQFKAGAAAGVVVGSFGGSVDGSTTTSMGADILAFSLDRGLFGGGAVEGAVFAKRADLNESFYAQAVEPRQIVLDGVVSNPAADSLRATLSALAE